MVLRLRATTLSTSVSLSKFPSFLNRRSHYLTMSSSKEALLSRLLQPESTTTGGGKSLIQVVGGDQDDVPKVPEPVAATTEAKPPAPEKKVQDDQPSILEMMMAAQREAKAEKDKDKAVEETKASTKPLGGGFKKGFFGGGGSSKPKAKAVPSSTTTTSSASSSAGKPEVVEIKKTAATSAKSNPLVFEDVQKAMDEDTHPLLKQLQSNDWMTPDLVSNFQSNKVVSNGFKNPKCMAAMQLLQKNPKEAQAKFQNDPEVSLFLQEFSKLMAGHFEALGNSSSNNQGSNSQGGSANVSMGSARGPSSTSSRVEELNDDGTVKITSDSTSTGAGIQEIGPLHAQVLQKKAQSTSAATPTAAQTAEKTIAKSSSSSSSTSTSAKSAPPTANPADEEERVKQILQDDELRTMLMDPDLQRILIECGDPVKFQQHMRNPETYRKIVRLQKAGLVGTAR